MKFFTRLFLVGILALSVLPAFAQDDEALNDPLRPQDKRLPFYAGPTVGYNRAMHSVELPSFDQDLCPKFRDGNSNGFWFGLTYESHLGPSMEASNSSIIMRVIYSTLPSSMETSEDPIASLVTTTSGSDVIVKSSTVHTVKVDYSLVVGEICYKLNPIPGSGLGITVGPTFDFALTRNLEQRYSLLQPLNAQFKRNEDEIKNKGYKYIDNDRTIIIKEGEIENSSGFRFALKAGLQYEILMGRMIVIPAVYYNLGITNLSSDQNWRVNVLQIGVDVRFAI